MHHDEHFQMSDTLRTAICIILSGGFQDAYTYCARDGVFANAQTGNIVLMSSHMISGEWPAALRYLIPVLAFLLGTAVAEIVHFRYRHCEKIHWRQIILLVEIPLLFAVGFLGKEWNGVANALVSFVCALQVQTFHKVHGHAYASTMCIGNLRSGMEALCAYFYKRDRAILKKALTYFSVIGIFAVGAGVGSYVTELLGYRAIWCSCALLSVSFFMMFVHTRTLKRKSQKMNERDG